MSTRTPAATKAKYKRAWISTPSSLVIDLFKKAFGVETLRFWEDSRIP
jgi:hypothetical protein